MATTILLFKHDPLTATNIFYRMYIFKTLHIYLYVVFICTYTLFLYDVSMKHMLTNNALEIC